MDKVLFLVALAAICVPIQAKYHTAPFDHALKESFSADVVGNDPGGKGTPEFECGWRGLAYDYGKQLFPGRGPFLELFDALELATRCNQTRPTARSGFRVGGIDSCTGSCVYVDPLKGNDNNNGAISTPALTMQGALTITRKTAPGTKTIVLRGGTHYLINSRPDSGTITLTPADSDLIITSLSSDEEPAVVSGAVQLTTEWKPYKVAPGNSSGPYNCSATPMIEDNVTVVRGGNDYKQVSIGPNDTMQACINLCCADPNCGATSWNGPPYTNSPYCFLKAPVPPLEKNGYGPGVRTAYKPNWEPPTVHPNIYVSTIPNEQIELLGPSGIVSLGFGADNRAIRARYPNSNPEFVPIYNSGGSWGQPPEPGCDKGSNPSAVVHIAMNSSCPEDSPNCSYAGMFQDYWMGYGGTCERFEVGNDSYWCQPNGRTGGATYCTRSPASVSSQLPNMPYAGSADGAVVTAWRGNGEWYTWQFEVDSYDQDTSKMTFGRGGFQGAEGSSAGGRWFIENIFEELDWPEEFIFNKTTGELYYFYNATGAPPISLQFEAPTLQVLFNINGTMTNPVRNVKIDGVTFTRAAPTYLAPHGIPSGGDWGLERLGAVVLQGTEGINITGCNFTKLDGNAIMLSGYSRNATIVGSEFSFLGANAVAAWGFTNGFDGTDGNQPRMTTMISNVCREIGHYQKQSSCWFQGKSCQNHILKNAMFNGPRAMINFNDGFGGASEVAENLVFNSCRESSDHGPFNSWDRVPYQTEVRDGTPSLIPAYNEIHNNMMVANYGADGGCLDNDDGSSWYMAHNNYFIFGGHKSDFDGHSKRAFSNYNIFAEVYGAKCLGGGNPHPRSDHLYDEGYWNNTCVLASAGDPYFSIGGCSETLTNATFAVKMGGNQLYVPNASISVSCGKIKDFAGWMALGLDPGTQVHDIPSVDTMISWGRALLLN